jgi:hypothetical protein
LHPADAKGFFPAAKRPRREDDAKTYLIGTFDKATSTSRRTASERTGLSG